MSPAVAGQGEGRLARRKLVRLLSPSGLPGSYDFKPGTAADLSDLFGPPEDFALSQPIHYVDGSNPPMLLMHGRDDNAVNVENTINLGNAVGRAGGQVKTVLYPELGHGLMATWLASYHRMRREQGSPGMGSSAAVPKFARLRAQPPAPADCDRLCGGDDGPFVVLVVAAVTDAGVALCN